MRGALSVMFFYFLLAGIIPADAGSTVSHSRPVCVLCGSSPRMRGAPLLPLLHPGPARIIPADAGSTAMTKGLAYLSGDHPRGCGEHTCGAVSGCQNRGSSPRMRGALLSSGWSGPDRWIIPADAGSTRTRRRECWPTWDHPRGCGEHSRSNCAMTANMGSSPRMRGALFTVCR